MINKMAWYEGVITVRMIENGNPPMAGPESKVAYWWMLNDEGFETIVWKREEKDEPKQS
jgi:hypothetical protein